MDNNKNAIIRQQQPTAQKWQVPDMGSSNQRQVFRNEEAPEARQAEDQQNAGIPTAKEIEQWHQEAHEEGYQAGLKQAETEINQLKQRLVRLINFFEAPLQELNEEVEQQLQLLAVTLAQQLVRREIRNDPGEIIAIIRESVQMLPASARHISVTLHPEDAELVKSALMLDGHDEEHNWKLIEDPMMTRGGCKLKADKSIINATLENRLQSLASSVLGGGREGDLDEAGDD